MSRTATRATASLPSPVTGGVRSGSIEAIERALVDLLRLMSSRRLHEARAASAGVRLSRTQLHLLSYLDEGGPCGVSQLAESAGISQPAASRALGQLAADGYVRRKDDRSDRRMTSIAITPDGRRVRLRLRQVMRRQLAEVLAPMPERRRAELGSLLTELVDRLKDPSGGATAMTTGRAAR